MKAATLVALVLLPALPAAARDRLTPEIRAYLAEHHFPGLSPNDPSIAAAVEHLDPPQGPLLEAARDPWEEGQLTRFAPNRCFFLLRTPDGAVLALHFRRGKLRNRKKLTPERVRVLRRLYSSRTFSDPPEEPLRSWLRRKAPAADAVLAAALERVQASRWTLSEETVKRARENFAKSRGKGAVLAVALAALGRSEHATECLWAGLWLISRMNRMVFHRKAGAKSVPDLSSVTARLFFENVLYAVRTRHDFPWGADVSRDDFLHHVLSPRGTGEPLQRWRRHFFLAMAPEVKDWSREDAARAVRFARACCYDFFQYEGATTWEDFGMLTALAVHEGRCEDCSNVENSMMRALGLPAAQAYTPWWAHADGNHAWTVVPSLDGGRNGNGKRAAKVYLKTWDGLTDITHKNTEVVDIVFATAAGVDARPELHVWNHGAWRLVARGRIEGGRARLRRVGCGRGFAFLLRVKGEADRLVRVRKGGAVTFLDNGTGAAPGGRALRLDFDKSCVLGEFKPDEEYRVYVHTDKGWTAVEAERLSTGAVGFPADPRRLYRLSGKGMRDRPFTVVEEDGEVTVLRH